MYEIFKNRNNYSIKHNRCILESKGNYRILVASPFCDKGRFVAILLRDFDLWYLEKSSVNEYISCPLTLSSTSYLNDVGNGLCKHASFSFLRSTQILTSPVVFLSWITIELIHSNSSIGSMIPASSMQSNSTFTFSLYLGFSLYESCLLR